MRRWRDREKVRTAVGQIDSGRGSLSASSLRRYAPGMIQQGHRGRSSSERHRLRPAIFRGRPGSVKSPAIPGLCVYCACCEGAKIVTNPIAVPTQARPLKPAHMPCRRWLWLAFADAAACSPAGSRFCSCQVPSYASRQDQSHTPSRSGKAGCALRNDPSPVCCPRRSSKRGKVARSRAAGVGRSLG